MLEAVTLDCECGDFCHVPNVACQTPSTAYVNLMLSMPLTSRFSFLHTGTAFMVIVLFRGRLVRQYRACVVDSLGLGITCVLYHSTMCTRHPDLVSFAFYAIPIFQHYNLQNFECICLLSFLN